MSAEDVAQQIERLATLIRRHQAKLVGEPFEKPFALLAANLKKFESTIASLLRQDDPQVEAFRERWVSPAAKIIHDEDCFKIFTKTVLGKTLTVKKGETPTKRRERFFALVTKQNLAGKAAKNFDLLIQQANHHTNGDN